MNSDDTNPYKAPSSAISESTADDVTPKKIPNKRVCAFLIDMIALAIIEAALAILSETIAVIFVLAYLLFRDAIFNGSSIGKRMVGIRTTDEDGEPCTPMKSFLRNIILIPLLLFPVALLIEYFVMRFSRREQRIGDRIARTLVVDLKPDRSDGSYILYSVGVIVAMLVISYILYS